MKKRIGLLLTAIIVALALIVMAIIQMIDEAKPLDLPLETEATTAVADGDIGGQIPDKTENTTAVSPETGTPLVNPVETECAHVLSDAWISKAGVHFRICTVDGCDYVQDEEKCSGGTADCLQRARCAVCGAEYGELGSHRWSEEWINIDAEQHGHPCITPGCSATSSAESHIFPVGSDNTAENICSLCGYQIAPTVHTHSLIAVAEVAPTCTSTGNSAYYRCSGCNQIFADPEGRQEIADLAHTVVPAAAHSADGTWKSDANSHWFACAFCGAELNKTEHAAGAEVQMDALQHWYTCVCGQPMNYGTHFDANSSGKCDVCGYALPVPETTAKPQESQAISQEGKTLEEILRPAQITILHPVASGTLTKSSTEAIVDYSNYADGYVMVRYTQSTAARLKVKIEGPTTTYTYNLPPQEWTVFPLSDGNGDYKITVYRNVTGNRYAVILAASFNVKLNNEFAPFLRPNQYVNYENAANSTAKAAELVGGISDTLKKVDAIYSFVTHHITYDYEKAVTVQSGYLPDLDRVLEEGKGICFDYAALMTGMLRSQNIACKLVVGYADSAYHAWISVWTPDQGWIDNAIFFDGTKWQTMDPTFASTGGSKAMEGVTYTSKYIY